MNQTAVTVVNKPDHVVHESASSGQTKFDSNYPSRVSKILTSHQSIPHLCFGVLQRCVPFGKATQIQANGGIANGLTSVNQLASEVLCGGKMGHLIKARHWTGRDETLPLAVCCIFRQM